MDDAAEAVANMRADKQESRQKLKELAEAGKDARARKREELAAKAATAANGAAPDANGGAPSPLFML
jgi:hypothetical protein